MSVITENIDSRPQTGTRTVKGRVRVKTSEEAPHLDNFFNGTPNWDLVTGVTRGKVYDAIKVEVPAKYSVPVTPRRPESIKKVAVQQAEPVEEKAEDAAEYAEETVTEEVAENGQE